MKLSDLVAYKTSLDHYDFIRSSRGLIKKINEGQADVDKSKHLSDGRIRFGHEDYTEQLAKDLDSVESQITNLQDNYSYYQEQIDQLILEHEEEYIKRDEENISQTLSEQLKCLTDRKLTMSTTQKREFIERIALYVDWRYPGLFIRPEDQDMVEAMCAFDPLYIADLYDERLRPFVKEFNPIYQNRIRPYTIPKLAPKQRSLDQLPQEQFGFIVAYNLFEHYSLSMIGQMLQEVDKLLKPGGTLLFTFNNCDLARNIRTVEMGLRCYTPYRLLKPIIEGLGYRIVKLETEGDNWLEIKKAGSLRSTRGGQTIGSVYHKKGDVLTKEDMYTTDQKEAIRQEAQALGLDLTYSGGADRPLGKLAIAIKRKKDEARIQSLVALKEHGRVIWRATNQGYLRGQHVRYGGVNYVATVDVEPKDTFDHTQWHLVK